MAAWVTSPGTAGVEREKGTEKVVQQRELEKGLANLAQVAASMGQKGMARDLVEVEKGRVVALMVVRRRELAKERTKARGFRHSNIRECGMTSQ